MGRREKLVDSDVGTWDTWTLYVAAGIWDIGTHWLTAILGHATLYVAVGIWDTGTHWLTAMLAHWDMGHRDTVCGYRYVGHWDMEHIG